MEYTEFLKQWFGDSECIPTRTSGSTGEPKEILLPKADMRRSAATAMRMFGLHPGCVVASALPLRSIATKMAIVRAIVAGGEYMTVEASNTLRLSRHVDLLSIAPSQADALISHPELRALTGKVLIGGAALSAARRDALLRCGYDIYETYGMTETCSNVALKHGADEYFTANPDITFSLDSRGCIIVHAPGYSFDGIATNDVARLLSPERFTLLGRYDGAINSGGIKLFPEDLERELAAAIYIPFYITGVPDEKWGQVAAVVVEGHDDDAARVAAIVAQAVTDGRRRPKFVMAMPRFERTATGKIRRIDPATTRFISKIAR